LLRIDPERKISFIDGFPLAHFFTLQSFGNTAKNFGPEAEQNQLKAWLYLKKMGLSPKNWIHLIPSKDPSRIVISKPEEALSQIRTFKGNAVISLERNAVLSLFPADCYPIFITDKTYSFLALVHGSLAAVRKGRIVERTIEAARLESDAWPDELIIGIGPGIKECCYKRGMKGIDLLETILRQLEEIPRKNIFIADVCTACGKRKDDYLFFSHQRSKKTKEPEGRFAAFVALKEP